MDKRRGSKSSIYKALALICLAICVVCLVWLAVRYVNNVRAENHVNDIREQYSNESLGSDPAENNDPENSSSQGSLKGDASGESQPETDGDGSLQDEERPGLPGLEEYDVPELNVDIKAVQENENPDVYAWLIVPGTKVDYPVLQHPDQPDYYLNHNLDGSTGHPACLYTQLYNSTDWQDKHTIIYGHNLSNGTMFASLHNYGDAQFFEEHPYMYIYTEDDRVLVYQIFAAYEFDDRHLLGCFDISTDAKYEDYLNSIWENEGLTSNFNKECELNADSKILTLSTCMLSTVRTTRRWLVQGVLVAEGEWEH